MSRAIDPIRRAERGANRHLARATARSRGGNAVHAHSGQQRGETGEQRDEHRTKTLIASDAATRAAHLVDSPDRDVGGDIANEPRIAADMLVRSPFTRTTRRIIAAVQLAERRIYGCHWPLEQVVQLDVAHDADHGAPRSIHLMRLPIALSLGHSLRASDG
jgi:hypothetical protein